MKEDGDTPYVSLEPQVEDAYVVLYVLSKLGIEEHIDGIISTSEGISEHTVIIRDKINSKYISVM